METVDIARGLKLLRNMKKEIMFLLFILGVQVALFVLFYLGGCLMWATFDIREFDPDGRIGLFSMWLVLAITGGGVSCGFASELWGSKKGTTNRGIG